MRVGISNEVNLHVVVLSGTYEASAYDAWIALITASSVFPTVAIILQNSWYGKLSELDNFATL